MAQNEWVTKLARGEEERILLARVLDRVSARDRKNIPQSTRFFTPAERALVLRLLQACHVEDYAFWGGYPGAERELLLLWPEYMTEDGMKTGEDAPLCVLHAAFYAEYELSHRDFLGALMGAGIARDCLGDILVGEGGCDFVVLREVADFLLTNFDTAGRARLRLSLADEGFCPPEQKFTLVRDTLASLRLDGLVSSGFSLAREKAADAIRAGRVKLNDLECTKPDARIAEGDRVSLRGLGKIELASTGGTSRKGRTIIEIKRYI